MRNRARIYFDATEDANTVATASFEVETNNIFEKQADAKFAGLPRRELPKPEHFEQPMMRQPAVRRAPAFAFA